MGGRYALHVALRHPDAVERLVLVSATAGIDDPGERADRRRTDDALAARVEADGVESFLRFWLDQPLFATLPAGAAGLETRLGGTAGGLASSLRLAGTGTQQPLWDRLAGIAVPVLVVAGQLDAKYTALGGRMARTIGPRARLEVLPGAGHACHLEQPGAFLDVVTSFLDAPRESTAPRQIQIPTASSTPKTSCRRPVAASTGISPRPSSPAITVRTGGMASGRAASASRAPGRAAARAAARANGSRTVAT